MEKEIQERQPKWHAALKVIDVVCMACIIHVIGMVGVVDIVGIVGIVGVIRPCSASRPSRRGKHSKLAARRKSAHTHARARTTAGRHVHAHRPKRRTEATTPSVFSALKLLCWHGLHVVRKLSLGVQSGLTLDACMHCILESKGKGGKRSTLSPARHAACEACSRR